MQYREIIVRHPQGLTMHTVLAAFRELEPYGIFPDTQGKPLIEDTKYVLRMVVDDEGVMRRIVRPLLVNHNLPIIGELVRNEE